MGSDPVEVKKARGMLELRQEVVTAKDDRTRRVLIGKGGKTITDVQRRSGAISIDVDHDNGLIRITGGERGASPSCAHFFTSSFSSFSLTIIWRRGTQ